MRLLIKVWIALLSSLLVAFATKPISIICEKSFDELFACNSTLYKGVFFQWTVDPELSILRGRVEFATHKDVFVGWGVSPKGNMKGSDAIIYNAFDGVVARYELNSYGTSGVLISPIQNLTDTASNFDESLGKISLSFDRPLVASSRKHIAIHMDKPQFMIWAIGSTTKLMHHSLRGTCEINFSDGIGSIRSVHATNKPKDNSANNVEPHEGGDALNVKLQKKHNHFHFLGINLHGSLMIFAWGIIFPIGAIVARYLRPMAQFKTGMWFQIHRVFQLFGLLITAGGSLCAVLLIYRKGGWGNLSFGAQFHAVIGIVLMCTLLAQIIAAIFRPQLSTGGNRANSSQNRVSWEKCHHLMGWFILGIGFCEIYVGLGFTGQVTYNRIFLAIVLIIAAISTCFLEKIRNYMRSEVDVILSKRGRSSSEIAKTSSAGGNTPEIVEKVGSDDFELVPLVIENGKLKNSNFVR